MKFKIIRLFIITFISMLVMIYLYGLFPKTMFGIVLVGYMIEHILNRITEYLLELK